MLESRGEIEAIRKTFGVGALDVTNLATVAEQCVNFSTKIEAHLYGMTEEECSPEYGRRFRELNQGLKHTKNDWLRRQLLLGEIMPEDFVKFDRN